MNVLSIRDWRVALVADKKSVEIVRGVSLEVESGDFYGLVGESGCGKSVTAMSITRLPPTDEAVCSGQVLFKGQNILGLRGAALRAMRGHGGISYIFQDPMSALNPVLNIEVQLREALPRGLSRTESRTRMLELLELVDLKDGEKVLKAYPCEMSGGMAQRICMAMAMASEPALLIADEPTTALDVVTQKRVLELLDGICRKTGTSVLLITHNLGLVARYAKSVSVMYAGLVVESGPVRDVLSNPRHPYTSGLIAAVPALDSGRVETLATIPGRVPPPSEWGIGCAFAPRCALAMPVCRESRPEARLIAGTHSASCFAVHQADGLGDTERHGQNSR